MKELKEKYSITLDPEVANAIRRMAEEDDRNFSQYINMILKKWVLFSEEENSKSTSKTSTKRSSKASTKSSAKNNSKE